MPAPTPTRINSASGGWDITFDPSPNDGIVLRDISLNGRYMAKSIDLPYFKIATSKTQGVKRGELKLNSDDAILRSRLVEYVATSVGDGIVLLAHYVIDRLGPTSESCLHVTQKYIFLGQSTTSLFQAEGCEPSATLPCAAFYPWVEYRFEGRGGETLDFFNIVQRNQFWVDGSPMNAIGVFRDCDFLGNCILNVEEHVGYVFRNKLNPLATELGVRVINRGLDTGQWDNIHQAGNSYRIEEPDISPGLDPHPHLTSGGCPECVHSHWRWGRSVPDAGNFGNGSIAFYHPNSNLDLDIGVVT